MVQHTIHRHTYQEQENHLACECGKKILKLNPTTSDGILKGIRSNGKAYSVRSDRHRYFFPDEWKRFIDSFTNKEHYFFFLTLLNTGARAMEAIHLKPENFNFDRGTVTFDVVKQRKAKKNFYAMGKSRTFFVSDRYIKEIRRWLSSRNLDPKDYLFMDKANLPLEYESLGNVDKKKIFH